MRAAEAAAKGTAPKAISSHLARMGDLGNVPRQEKKFKVCVYAYTLRVEIHDVMPVVFERSKLYMYECGRAHRGDWGGYDLACCSYDTVDLVSPPSRNGGCCLFHRTRLAVTKREAP